jgi:hypothetical protein
MRIGGGNDLGNIPDFARNLWGFGRLVYNEGSRVWVSRDY